MAKLIPLIAALSLSGGVAFAQTPRPMSNPADGKAASQATQDFVQKAQAGTHFEVETGTLAANQAGDAKVKQFGKMMVSDHSKAGKNLAATLKSDRSAGLPSDTAMNAEQTSEYNKLKGLRGAEFDKQYVQTMLKDHQEDAQLFDDYAKSGDDPKVKAFAKKTAAVIHKHLQHVQQLQTQMNRSAAR
jgi:putative membrane protein